MTTALEFSLYIKPFSVNRMSSRDQRFKTAAFRDWALEVIQHLNEEKELTLMGEDWKRNGGTFVVHFEFIHPYGIYFNKSGLISNKSFDLSNVEKPLLDLIFGDTMGVNDRNVVKLVSTKRDGPQWCINVAIEWMPDAA